MYSVRAQRIKMERSAYKRKRPRYHSPAPICICHVEGIKCGELKLLSKDQDGEKKLRKLHEVRERRMNEPQTSSHRMEKTCRLVPETLSDHHGFHVECYKRFTMNLGRLQSSTSKMIKDSKSQRESQRHSSQNEKILFKPDSIFCGSEARKKVKMKGVWTSQGMSAFEFDGWKAVMAAAERKQDEKLLRRIPGYDLFACEAKYHKNCRMN